MTTPETPDLKAICRLAFVTGIYFQRQPDGTYSVGPKHVVQQHPELVGQLRDHKPTIMALIESHRAAAVLGSAADDDPAYTTVICPHCHMQVYLFKDWLTATDKTRMASHRMQGGKKPCPGSTEFVEERTLQYDTV